MRTTLRQVARFFIITCGNTTNPEQIVITQRPFIDLRAARREIAQQIAEARRPHGFFYTVGPNVDETLALRLEELSHQFFALPEGTLPLHGANLVRIEAVLPDFRRTVLQYIDQVTRHGHRVLDAIAESLVPAPDCFASRCAGDRATRPIRQRLRRSKLWR
jgi:isopenicillin N synthase-like dioxygenase